MRLYHATTRANALAIIAGGFVDRTGTYGTDTEWSGVWLSNRVHNCNDGVDGDTVLLVELRATEEELADYEWIDEERVGHREWLVPAALIAERGSISMAPAEDQIY